MKGWEYERCPKCNARLNETILLKRLSSETPVTTHRLWCPMCEWSGREWAVNEVHICTERLGGDTFTILGEDEPCSES